MPTNNLPVCLTSAFRRLIGTTTTQQLNQHYHASLPNKWGFQKGTNTVYATAFASTQLRKNLPRAAIMDLKNPYDRVPRRVVHDMI